MDWALSAQMTWITCRGSFSRESARQMHVDTFLENGCAIQVNRIHIRCDMAAARFAKILVHPLRQQVNLCHAEPLGFASERFAGASINNGKRSTLNHMDLTHVILRCSIRLLQPIAGCGCCLQAQPASAKCPLDLITWVAAKARGKCQFQRPV